MDGQGPPLAAVSPDVWLLIPAGYVVLCRYDTCAKYPVPQALPCAASHTKCLGTRNPGLGPGGRSPIPHAPGASPGQAGLMIRQFVLVVISPVSTCPGPCSYRAPGKFLLGRMESFRRRAYYAPRSAARAQINSSRRALLRGGPPRDPVENVSARRRGRCACGGAAILTTRNPSAHPGRLLYDKPGGMGGRGTPRERKR